RLFGDFLLKALDEQTCFYYHKSILWYKCQYINIVTMSLLISKNIVVLGIIAFLAMSFWSLFSMSMDMNGRMVNCPFMNDSSSFCQMSVAEHINQWQQFFTMTKEKSLILSLFSLLISFVTGFFITTKAYEKLKHQQFRNYFYRHKP